MYRVRNVCIRLPPGQLSLKDKKAFIISQDCMKCGHCSAICPVGAISISGYDEEPVEIEKALTLDSEELMGALRTRRSMRKFTADEVPEDALNDINQAVRITPTGSNSQDVEYTVITRGITEIEKDAVKIFRKMMPVVKRLKPALSVEIDDHFFFKGAPLVIVISAKSSVNGSLAAANMALMAESHGLGVLYSGLFTLAAKLFGKIRQKLGIKRKFLTALVIGYPGVKYRRTVQRDPASVTYM